MSEVRVPLSIEYLDLRSLKPNPGNARTHSKYQIRQIARSIQKFGFLNPVIVDRTGMIIAGHGRVRASTQLGIDKVPVIRVEDLTPDDLRAYVIADNRIAEKAGWDESILAIELDYLIKAENIEMEITGFEIGEIDLILQSVEDRPVQSEVVDLTTGPAVTQPGDLWHLAEHRIQCGSSLEEHSYITLMDRHRAEVVFADPPYNLPIDGYVSGKGSIHHREFAMASGEMSEEQFLAFLTSALRLMTRFSKPGSVHYLCIDWRHMRVLLDAGQRIYDQLLNCCVWVKNTGGMGSFYRSQHELIIVFRNGNARQRNNVQLGKFGRNRTNVWQYPGANAFSKSGEEGNLLALHPTVKPVALVADALLDCTARGDLVLDSFLGSGSTLIAAERTGRRCYGIEIDPIFVDTAVRRWQRHTGDHAVHAIKGKRFDEVANEHREAFVDMTEISHEQ